MGLLRVALSASLIAGIASIFCWAPVTTAGKILSSLLISAFSSGQSHAAVYWMFYWLSRTCIKQARWTTQFCYECAQCMIGFWLLGIIFIDLLYVRFICLATTHYRLLNLISAYIRSVKERVKKKIRKKDKITLCVKKSNRNWCRIF